VTPGKPIIHYLSSIQMLLLAILFLVLPNKQFMKKTIRIIAIGLIVFALVTNLHAAIFSFYGIRTNSLQNAIWASSLTSSTPSGGTTGSTASFFAGVNTPVQCGEMKFSGSTTNHGAASVSYTTSPAGTVTATVSYATSGTTTYTGSVAAHSATMVQCIGPLTWWCSNVSAQDACQ